MSQGALDLMYALRIEDDRPWGEAAAEWQVADATAILLNERPLPTWHFLTRPRGGSKSTDMAGVAIAWLATDARPLANGHIVAASGDQAAIIIDAAAGFVARTPELGEAINVESKRIVGRNGAWVEILAQSDSGAWGLRDAHILIADEFCQWPSTRGAKRVWRAIQSAAPKVTGCRLIVMSSAGEPSHWSREVFEKAEMDPMWRVHEVPGPVPWLSEDELTSLQYHMSPSEYERLVLNIWAEDEDSAVSEDDWNIAAQPYKTRTAQPRVRYIICVDIGLVDDATAIAIMHREPIDPEQPLGPQRVVVDHMERWRGSRKKPINLSAVEDFVVAASHQYNHARVYADPTQFVGSLQRINMRGVSATEFKFTATSVGEVAGALTSAFRNHQIYVPNLPVLKQELLSLKLRETVPGVTRLDHLRNAHDDQAVVIGMGCHTLIKGAGGTGEAWMAWMKQQQAENLTNPKPLPQAPGIGDYFRALSAPAHMARGRFCAHRIALDTGACLKCGDTRCDRCGHIHDPQRCPSDAEDTGLLPSTPGVKY